ncbi:MAG: SMI1/KNR4 family protein [Sphingobacteriales bacterium]|nr:MAG: SMI1/KNR4 family protein [Sphingobacteriales bacterium]
MTEIILKLNEKAGQLQHRSFWNTGASVSEISQFEAILKITLPPTLKSFYTNCNGGCFADDSWSDEDLENAEMKAGIIWNSNYFLSLQEIMDAYRFEGEFIAFDIQEMEQKTGKRYIPIIHTKEQEILVWEASNLNESPIIYACHELNPAKWKVLFQSFDELLNSYIELEGEIETY